MQFGDGRNSKMRNIYVELTFNGTNYHGWQIQNNAVTIQEVLQTALDNIIDSDYEIKGCSRTDAGVHANVYCLNIMTRHNIQADKLKGALNRFLPVDIAAMVSKDVPNDFHARYTCKSKEYEYLIWNNHYRNPFYHDYALHYKYELDVDLLNKAGQAFVGTHDFTSFCTLDERERGDFTRTVNHFTVIRDGSLVRIRVEADGFLYNMVRIMVGTMLKVAQGKIGVDEIESIINAKDRSLAGPTAPAHGLYLNKVNY